MPSALRVSSVIRLSLSSSHLRLFVSSLMFSTARGTMPGSVSAASSSIVSASTVNTMQGMMRDQCIGQAVYTQNSTASAIVSDMLNSRLSQCGPSSSRPPHSG